MTQFYTVRMNRKQMISEFDTKGRKTGEREELIPLTFTDLPYSTAMAYKEKDPSAVIERQIMSGKSERSTFQHSGKRSAPVQREKKAAAAPQTPSNKHTGTYGALVNAMGDQ